jgi:hypothetical protein
MKSIILFLILLTGCSEGVINPNDKIYISPEFTSEQIETIISGIDEWHTATNGSVSLQVYVGHNEAGHSISPKVYPGYFGMTEADSWSPYVRTYLNLKELSNNYTMPVNLPGLKETIMHELMHGFGFKPHLSHGLMTASHLQGACIDNYTLKHYCDMNSCSNGFIDSCITSTKTETHHSSL